MPFFFFRPPLLFPSLSLSPPPSLSLSLSPLPLSPNNSAVAGVALPLYHSAAAVADPSSSKVSQARRKRWLRYWCVLGAAALAEKIVFGGGAAAAKASTSSTPRRTTGGALSASYPHARLLFLLWLTSSKYQGARRLFDGVVAPAAAAAAPAVAEAKRDAAALVGAHPGVAAAADAAHRALASLPVLKWVLEVPEKEEGENGGGDGSGKDESEEEAALLQSAVAAANKKKKKRKWPLSLVFG